MPSRYNPDLHHRRSIRLKGCDYSTAGAYFITLLAYQRQCLFGTIEAGEMRLSRAGEVVRSHWMKLPQHYPYLQLDEFVVMPNHFHGILILVDVAVGERRADISVANDVQEESQGTVRAGLASNPSSPTHSFTAKPALAPSDRPTLAPRHGIPEILRSFKTFSARRINQIRKTSGIPVWHRNYYEHIIRTNRAYQNIRQYIQTNPERWQQDKLFANQK